MTRTDEDVAMKDEAEQAGGGTRNGNPSEEVQQESLFIDRSYDERGRAIPKLRVLSFGAGQDSTALLEMWLNEETFRREYPAEHLLCVMSDTGDEHTATYEHVERCRAKCDEREDITFVHITPDMGYHTESWSSLIEHYRRTDTVGSKAYVKSCSANLKINVLYKYLDVFVGRRFGFDYGRKKALYAYQERFGKIPVMIGIAAGEESRAKGDDTGPKWMQRTIRKVYPLIEMEMDRADCQKKIREVGGTVPRPSLCRRCPFKTEEMILVMAEDDPEGLREWIEIEKNKLDAWEKRCEEKGTKNLGVWSDGRTLPEVLEDAREKFEDVPIEKLRETAFNHGHCVSTTY